MKTNHSVLLLNLFCFMSICGTAPSTDSDSSARIVNGYKVDISEIPYHAALRRKLSLGWTHFCGATIISSKAVVTAAHCTIGYATNPSDVRVTVGTSYRLSGGKTYKVSEIVNHEDYSADILTADIALVITNDAIKTNTEVAPVAVAPSYHIIPEGTEATVSGYGTTEYEGKASAELLAAKVYVVSQETCLKAYLQIAPVSSGMICAAAADPPRDACQGDSGGPLVADNVLIGIVSWGEGCAHPLYPGVYTRVSEYSQWINEKLNEYLK